MLTDENLALHGEASPFDGETVRKAWEDGLGAFFVNSWIGRAPLQLEADGTLKVRVPSASHVQRLTDPRIRGRLLEIASGLCPSALSVDFVVDPSLLAGAELRPPVVAAKIAPVHPEPIRRRERPAFDERYRFDTFVEGPANRMALSACRQVSEAPGTAGLNPLVLHGGSGLGKTHLLHALGAQAWETRTAERVMLRTSEQLVVELIHDRDRAFADYRRADMLLVDDVQFLVGKVWMTHQFALLVQDLLARGKQVVAVSDKPIERLNWTDGAVAKAMAGGLTLQMEIPDRALRMEIIRAKMNMVDPGSRLSDEVMEFVAENEATDVRTLEGVLLKLTSYRSLFGRECTLELAQSILADRIRDSRSPLSLETVAAETAHAFGVTAEHLKGKSRLKEFALPRKVAMYLARILLDQTLHSIGFFFNRDFSTVSAALKSAEELLSVDPDLADRVETLRDRLVRLRNAGN